MAESILIQQTTSNTQSNIVPGYFVGEAFNCNVSGKKITKVIFKLMRSDTLTGTYAAAYLYAATGTVGSTAYPTGSVLATSDSVDVSDVTMDGAGEERTFTFTGDQQYELTNGNNYAIAFKAIAGGNWGTYGAQFFRATSDADGTASNFYEFWEGTYYPAVDRDAYFKLYVDDAATPPAAPGSFFFVS